MACACADNNQAIAAGSRCCGRPDPAYWKGRAGCFSPGKPVHQKLMLKTFPKTQCSAHSTWGVTAASCSPGKQQPAPAHHKPTRSTCLCVLVAPSLHARCPCSGWLDKGFGFAFNCGIGFMLAGSASSWSCLTRPPRACPTLRPVSHAADALSTLQACQCPA